MYYHITERKTLKSLYVLVKNKTQKEVIKAIRKLKKRVGGDFSQVFKTITADNGSEFLDGSGIKEHRDAMKYTMHTHIAATKEAVMKTEIAYYAGSYLKERIFQR